MKYLLSLSCKTSLSYNAIYLPKLLITLPQKNCHICHLWWMSNIYGLKCSHVKANLIIKSLMTFTQTNQPHGYLRKANLVLIFEGPTFHLCYSNWFLHLCVIYNHNHLYLYVSGTWRHKGWVLTTTQDSVAGRRGVKEQKACLSLRGKYHFTKMVVIRYRQNFTFILPFSNRNLLECPVCLELAWPPKKIYQVAFFPVLKSTIFLIITPL